MAWPHGSIIVKREREEKKGRTIAVIELKKNPVVYGISLFCVVCDDDKYVV
jgi:hypothetical protein